MPSATESKVAIFDSPAESLIDRLARLLVTQPDVGFRHAWWAGGSWSEAAVPLERIVADALVVHDRLITRGVRPGHTIGMPSTAAGPSISTVLGAILTGAVIVPEAELPADSTGGNGTTDADGAHDTADARDEPETVSGTHRLVSRGPGGWSIDAHMSSRARSSSAIARPSVTDAADPFTFTAAFAGPVAPLVHRLGRTRLALDAADQPVRLRVGPTTLTDAGVLARVDVIRQALYLADDATIVSDRRADDLAGVLTSVLLPLFGGVSSVILSPGAVTAPLPVAEAGRARTPVPALRRIGPVAAWFTEAGAPLDAVRQSIPTLLHAFLGSSALGDPSSTDSTTGRPAVAGSGADDAADDAADCEIKPAGPPGAGEQVTGAADATARFDSHGDHHTHADSDPHRNPDADVDPDRATSGPGAPSTPDDASPWPTARTSSDRHGRHESTPNDSAGEAPGDRRRPVRIRSTRRTGGLIAGRVEGPFCDPRMGGDTSDAADAETNPRLADHSMPTIGDATRFGPWIPMPRGPWGHRIARRLRACGVGVGPNLRAAGGPLVRLPAPGSGCAHLHIGRGLTLGPDVELSLGVRATLHIDDDVVIERGAALCVRDGATLVIGRGAYIGSGVMIDAAGGVTVGPAAELGPRSMIVPGAGVGIPGIRTPSTHLGRGARLGARALLIGGVGLAEGTVVPAGDIRTASRRVG